MVNFRRLDSKRCALLTRYGDQIIAPYSCVGQTNVLYIRLKNSSLSYWKVELAFFTTLLPCLDQLQLFVIIPPRSLFWLWVWMWRTVDLLKGLKICQWVWEYLRIVCKENVTGCWTGNRHILILCLSLWSSLSLAALSKEEEI